MDHAETKSIWDAIDAASLEVDERSQAQALDQVLMRCPPNPLDEGSGPMAYLWGYAHYIYPNADPKRRLRARRWLERALELAPGDPLSLLYLGYHHYDVQEYEQAAARFEQVDTTMLDPYLRASALEMRLCCGLILRRPPHQLMAAMEDLLRAASELIPEDLGLLALHRLRRNSPGLFTPALNARVERLDAMGRLGKGP